MSETLMRKFGWEPLRSCWTHVTNTTSVAMKASDMCFLKLSMKFKPRNSILKILFAPACSRPGKGSLSVSLPGICLWYQESITTGFWHSPYPFSVYNNHSCLPGISNILLMFSCCHFSGESAQTVSISESK